MYDTWWKISFLYSQVKSQKISRYLHRWRRRRWWVMEWENKSKKRKEIFLLKKYSYSRSFSSFREKKIIWGEEKNYLICLAHEYSFQTEQSDEQKSTVLNAGIKVIFAIAQCFSSAFECLCNASLLPYKIITFHLVFSTLFLNHTEKLNKIVKYFISYQHNELLN